MKIDKIPLYRQGSEGFFLWVEDNVFLEIPDPITKLKKWTPVKNMPTEPNPVTGRSFRSIWDNQKKELREALKMDDAGNFIYRLIVLCWMRGEGKCQEKGSKVLMYDGAVKKVEDVKVGDLLMGDDNTPRKVLSLASGKEEMFEVVPARGESMVVTGDHILSLKRRREGVEIRAGKVVDISVDEYQKQSESFKKRSFLYRTPIDWPEQEVSIHPYFLGLWLADSHSTRPSITTMDKEVVEFLYAYAEDLDMDIACQGEKRHKTKTYSFVGESIDGNYLLSCLRDYNLVNNKHVPQEYKSNSREVRLRILAGIVDSVGYKTSSSIQITLKRKTLSEDVAFLARSLGLRAKIKEYVKTIESDGFSDQYYRVDISGDCFDIPSIVPRKKCEPRSDDRKDILVTNIKEIKSAGEREYYGFMLDGNGRYVTGDFTVTHNSAMVCLMKLWKFFCFPRQLIVLGANSKDQSQFVHFDIMRDVILNSPPLLNVIGRKNILNNMIIMKKGDEVFSSIRTISSFSGIVSNITGYTFSEMFDMKNPKFFVQLDGSTRNIPNAMGMIDSTVASKDHILYSLFESFINQTDPYIYFSFRSSPNADSRDYWHPEMTQKQLNSYKTRFPPDEFDRYFKNVWELTGNRLFSVDMIDASNYIGLDGEFNTSSSLILSLCKQRVTALSEIRRREIENLKKRKGYIKRKRKTGPGITKKLQLIKEIDSRLISIDDELNLGREENRIVTPDGLGRLSEIYDTDWVITAGVDRADPESEGKANSIVAFLAKGLEGSASFRYTESSSIDYLYFLIGLILIRDDSLKDIKEWVGYVDDEFSGLDALCSERWAMWDIKDWCDEREIPLELIFPTYERQRAAFSEMYRSLSIARFKAPTIPIPGAKEHDVFREELSYFDHDSRKKQYKSIEKDPKSKKPILVQDDSMYATGWAFYGGRELTVSDLRPRNQKIFMGHFVPDPNTHSHQMAIRDNPGTVPVTRGRR